MGALLVMTCVIWVASVAAPLAFVLVRICSVVGLLNRVIVCRLLPRLLRRLRVHTCLIASGRDDTSWPGRKRAVGGCHAWGIDSRSCYTLKKTLCADKHEVSVEVTSVTS